MRLDSPHHEALSVHIVSVGNVVNLNALVAELGCWTGHLPSTSLGLPLGASHKSGAVWDSDEERMRKNFAPCKRNYISKGGRVTLIKRTLASFPLYQMSLVRMSTAVAKRLEKLQRNSVGWWGARKESLSS